MYDNLSIYSGEPVHDSEGRVRANQWTYGNNDNDGAMDLVAGVGDWTEYGWDNTSNDRGIWMNGPLHGYVYLLRNTGTTGDSHYADLVKIRGSGEPIDVFGIPLPSFADFDGDGDLDLVCGKSVDKFTYFQNTSMKAIYPFLKKRPPVISLLSWRENFCSVRRERRYTIGAILCRRTCGYF